MSIISCMLFAPEVKDKVEAPKDTARPDAAAARRQPLFSNAGLAAASGRHFLRRGSPRHEKALKRSPIF